MNPTRRGFTLPQGLPKVLEPGTAFEITLLDGRLERWTFRATRQSEIRELLLHRVHGGFTALDVGRKPVLFAVGEVLRLIEFRIVFVPAVIVYPDDSRGFIRTAVDGQDVDELIAAIESDLGER